MDIPALDVNGACLSVIGQRGAESPGVLVFPSLHGFKQFLKATSTGAIETGGALHRSPRWPWDFGLTESAEREPHSPGPEEEVPAEGWPEEPCPCGRGRRYKMCHLAQDEG